MCQRFPSVAKNVFYTKKCAINYIADSGKTSYAMNNRRNIPVFCAEDWGISRVAVFLVDSEVAAFTFTITEGCKGDDVGCLRAVEQVNNRLARSSFFVKILKVFGQLA